MGDPTSRDGVTTRCRNGQRLIIAFAICGLIVSLATRVFHFHSASGVSVTFAVTEAMRQHMDRDAVWWLPPVPVLTMLQVPTFYPYVAPAGPPLPSMIFDESLTNRPPPTC